jgi:hypothetical protein
MLTADAAVAALTSWWRGGQVVVPEERTLGQAVD